MWQTGGNFLESGETTAQLAIPKAPFIYGMSVLCVITGLVHLAFMIRPVAGDWKKAKGARCDRSTDRLHRHLRAGTAARAAGLRHGPGRHRRHRPDAQLGCRPGQHGAGGPRNRIRLHAVGDSAVHPDGQLRRPRRDWPTNCSMRPTCSSATCAAGWRMPRSPPAPASARSAARRSPPPPP